MYHELEAALSVNVPSDIQHAYVVYRLVFCLADLFCSLKMFVSQCLKHQGCGLLLISDCQWFDGKLHLVWCAPCVAPERGSTGDVFT